VEYYDYLGSMINDTRFQHEIKSRFAMTKAAFNKKKKTFPQQSGFKYIYIKNMLPLYIYKYSGNMLVLNMTPIFKDFTNILSHCYVYDSCVTYR